MFGMDRIAMLLVFITKVSSLPGHNVSQSSDNRPLNDAEMAVDDDQNTCAVTERGVNEYWRIQFNQTITVKGMALRLKGGNFSVEVRNSSNETADRQICDSIHLPFDFVAYPVNISCKPAVPMDVVMISRTNYGSLTLCDFRLRVCDIPCELCIFENTCRHCDDYHYGPNCENTCSAGCVPESCDDVTGECSACLVGYSGKQCQLKFSSLPGHNVSQSSVNRPLNGAEMAVNDDLNICAVTERGVNEYWRIQFNQTITVKGMALRLKGGNFSVEYLWTSS
uniref:Uncharacterized protein LOC111122205 isoform X1 n=1 Tax=Crassostrea virginica TaxID=6565 RepID=A0A8B8CUQ6_CRAVI|nr:uncharacterized protein LOC111122205 isoform X1 [Crassostrea virginica]